MLLLLLVCEGEKEREREREREREKERKKERERERGYIYIYIFFFFFFYFFFFIVFFFYFSFFFFCVHHPDHVKRVVAKIARCFQAGEIWEDTFPLRGRDGKYRMFLSRAVPVRDPEGKALRWFGTNTDISESTESGARYRGLLEAAPDAMVVVNDAGEIVLLNVQAEKWFGYNRDELIGQKVKNIIPEGGTDHPAR